MPEWGTTFGSRLRWARELLGVNGQDVALRVNALGGKATKSRISEWERGTVPRPATQRMLARAVGQPAEWLMAGLGNPTVPDDGLATLPPARVDPLRVFSTEQLVDLRVKNDQLLAALQRQMDQIEEVIRQRAGTDPSAADLLAQIEIERESDASTELERELESEAQRLEGQRAADEEAKPERRRRGRAS